MVAQFANQVKSAFKIIHKAKISKEIDFLIFKYFNLIDPPFQSNIYQNLSKYIQYEKTGEKFDDIMSTIISDKTEDKNNDDIIAQNKYKEIRRKQLLLRFKQIIKQCMNKFKQMRISLDILFYMGENKDKKVTYEEGLYLFNVIKAK